MPDEKMIRVSWFEHNCEWITKHCEENHRAYALVPVSVVRQYRVPAPVYID